MPYSYQSAVSDGTLSTLLLTIDYADRSEISVTFDDDIAHSWSWVGVSEKQLSFSPAIPNGVTVLVLRQTDIEDSRHLFATGARFSASAVDQNFQQLLAAAQELRELATGGVGPIALLEGDLADTDNPGKGDAMLGVSVGTAGRTQHSKNQESPSVQDFGANPDGVTASGGAFTDAESSAFSELAVPQGVYRSMRTKEQFGKRYVGSGSIKTYDGRKRGRWLKSVTTGLTSRGNTSDEHRWYDGDWSNCFVPIEYVISQAPITTGSLVLAANAAAGADTLVFASVPSWVGVGARDMDSTGGSDFNSLVVSNATAPSSVAADTRVVSITPTLVRLSKPLAGPVSAGQVIRFGYGQYLQPYEACPINVSMCANPGSINANQAQDSTAAGGIVVHGVNVNIKNDSGGSGMGAFCALVNVARESPYYSPTNAYSGPAGWLLSGQVASNCNNAYLTGIEYVLADNGNKGVGIGMVIDCERQHAGEGRHHFWRMIHFNGSAHLPVDSWLGGNAKAKYGLDMTAGDFSSNYNAAIALKANQRIYMNAAGDALGASAVGTSSLYYNSFASKAIINVGDTDLYQFDQTGGLYIATPSGKVIIDGTQVLQKRDTGWAAMTGTSNKATAYDTATVTLAQLAARVKALQDILAAHGLIGV